MIAKKIAGWYAKNRRDLPWRETTDPYRIWLSEVILQQTRVAQGLSYYQKFISRFPDVRSLASAPESEVLKLWQGLGYYSRARNLHAAARSVADSPGGRFPATYSELRALKGIGDYTAAAIASFAFGEPRAVVDGNVYRVLSRLFDIEEPIDGSAGKKVFSALADDLLSKKDPATHNQAMMEFGALHCTPRQPLCGTCPVREHCLAYANGTVDRRPVKGKKAKQRSRYFHYLVITDPAGTGYVMQKRSGKDIWKNLMEFLLIEHEAPLEPEACLDLLMDKLPGYGKGKLSGKPRAFRHVLSHQIIHAVFMTVVVPKPPAKTGLARAGAVWVRSSELGDQPVSRLTEMFLEEK